MTNDIRGAAICVKELSKQYAVGASALESVDLDVRAGEFVSVLGPSGCGKSTLMLIVAGLLEKTSGTVTVNDSEVEKPLNDVGIVFQDDLLLEFRTTLGNVALQCEIRGMPRGEARKRARAVLERMGLAAAEHKYPHELSGGMRQRASIARAFIHEPSTLLMDEPFGALDAISRIRMQGELESLWLDGPRKTVLFITHSVEEAVRLSDRVVVLSPSPGRVAAEFTIDVPRPRPVVIEEDPLLTGYSRKIYGLFEQLGVFDE
ncbi:MAG: ABC transporter ATP-binding protein [Pseudonocardia sp.]|nr:ABC transporter ATP-binding protein [Pseudonocardia sp.]